LTFCVGLTGGIGCGKSKAADMFGALGADVVDTDAISHALTASGGKAMPEVAEKFGAQYIEADGRLNRAAMRALVFSDAAAKTKLESILHPLIRAESHARMESTSAPYVILVVPLLLETGAYADVVNRVLVVDCAEEQQIARTMARSGLTEAEIRAIMAAQVPRATRLERADDVLTNDFDIDTLRERVRALHARYVSDAQEAASR
jgi:dephospho-CoA kinase